MTDRVGNDNYAKHFKPNMAMLRLMERAEVNFLAANLENLAYRNVPKFSDRQIWANSADPDQTAPRGAV